MSINITQYLWEIQVPVTILDFTSDKNSHCSVFKLLPYVNPPSSLLKFYSSYYETTILPIKLHLEI